MFTLLQVLSWAELLRCVAQPPQLLNCAAYILTLKMKDALSEIANDKFGLPLMLRKSAHLPTSQAMHMLFWMRWSAFCSLALFRTIVVHQPARTAKKMSSIT